MAGVHALTDVTGFGLAGHLLEICRGSKLAAELDFRKIPVIEEARAFLEQGVATGASDRNWSGYGHEVQMAGHAEAWKQKLLTDPQTSGGLLVACAPEAVDEVVRAFAAKGFQSAAVIGKLSAGKPGITVV
jgi:selenide,water dikinase